jgi:hypothetical protein
MRGLASGRHSPLEQNGAEALALRGRDWWTSTLLPLKENARLESGGV